MKEIGKIRHFYQKINVAVVELTDELKQGDEILIKGKITNLRQKAESMQVEHKNIAVAKKGESIGLKVNEPVKENDTVYKV